MRRRAFEGVEALIRIISLAGFLFATGSALAADDAVIRIGIIGLDTSHAPAFAKEFNATPSKPDLVGFRVVAAYPKGSPDIESSVKRVPEYIKSVEKVGVKIVNSIDELLTQVDAVLLESNDGRPHAEQVLPVLKAHKPVFVDKPVAGSLVDAVRMYEAAEHFKTPMFSSSSLRFGPVAQQMRNGKLGRVLGADAYSPCHLESTHPDLFWYGIHGVETLFTVMGPGCASVVRVNQKDQEVVMGTWSDGRVGIFRGLHTGKPGYGGTVFGEKGNGQIGDFVGYRPLVLEIASFFRTGKPPVSSAETLELYAFMEAADESKRKSGAPVSIADTLKKARAEAAPKPLR